MDNLHFKTAKALAALIKTKQVSSTELLEHFLTRTATHNPKLNAFIWMNKDAAMQRAREADDALARGEDWGPLHGLPMTIKESYEVAGSPTTWGVPGLKDNMTETSA